MFKHRPKPLTALYKPLLSLSAALSYALGESRTPALRSQLRYKAHIAFDTKQLTT